MRDELKAELLMALSRYCPDRQDIMQDAKFAFEIILDKYEISRRETTLIVREDGKTEAVIKKFLYAKLAAGLSKNSVNYYRLTIGKFFRKTGKDYDKITPDDVRLYFALRVQQDGISKSTANNERRNLSSFFGWLQKEEILLKNPMAKVDVIKETKKQKRAYELMDLEKIRMGCRTSREKAIVEILASTWCRVSELVGIKVSDINNGRITVRGKGDKYRDVFINARAQLALDTYLAERHDSNPYLFPRSKYAGRFKEFAAAAGHKSPAEMPLWYQNPESVDDRLPADRGTIESIIKRIGRRAGVSDCHPHRFRRTGATLALRAGMPLSVVQKLLGHSSIETTQIYLDISDDEMEQAHKRFVF